MKTLLLSLGWLFACVPAWGDAPSFRMERPVTFPNPGAYRLAVDVPLLTNGTLDDLRFFDPEGTEVSYLVMPPDTDAPVTWDGTLLPTVPDKTTSGLEVDLGAPRLVRQLRLDGLPVPLLKKFRLEASGDRAHWVLLISEATIFDLPDETLQRLVVAFPSGEYRYFRITWDDRASARVPVPSRVVATSAVDPTMTGAIIPLTFTRRISEPGVSRFRVRLPGPHLPIVAVYVEASEPTLHRMVKVHEARLVGQRVSPISLGSATIRRTVQEQIVAEQLRIPIGTPQETELELVVEDGNNPPLQLTLMGAELAPVPSLYIESRTPTLIARYGAALAAPRYDLEARRAAIAAALLPEGEWGAPVALQPAPATVVANGVPTVGTVVDRARFRYARPIASANALAVVPLDAAVVAHSDHFADLRIVDAEGRQHPYLLEQRDEPLLVPLAAAESITPVAATGAAARVSRYRVRLPYDRFPVSHLRLATSARVFSRTVRILVTEPAADRRSQLVEREIASAEWSHIDLEQPAPDLSMALPQLTRDEVIIALDEGDNAPLPLLPPHLLLPSYRLRYVASADAVLTLYYGDPALAAPTYDIALIARYLMGSTAIETTLGAETAVGASAAPRRSQTVFWIGLVLTVLILLGILVRLLRKG